MFLYYIVIVILSIILYCFLTLRYSLTRLGVIFIVFFVLFLSSLFPGLVSVITPAYSLGILFLAAFLGGSLFYNLAIKKDARKSKGESKVQDMLKEQREKKESDLQPFSGVTYKEKEEALHTILKDREVKGERKEGYLLESQEIVYDIIDRAYKAKEKGDYARALQLFNTVLRKSKESSIKGVILSEMIGLYKKKGTYLEGAETIEGFLKIEQKFPPSLEKHLLSLSSYFRKLDELLIKAKCPEIPYDQVSALIKTKAERILRENSNTKGAG